MKFKLLTLFAAFSVLLASLCGCGNTEVNFSVAESKNFASETESDTAVTEISEETIDIPKTEMDTTEIVEEAISETEASTAESTLPETDSEQNSYGAYEKILDSLYYMLLNGLDYNDETEGISGVLEATLGYKNRQEALAAVGFIIEDLSGDGIPELIIASNLNGSNYGTPIYALYSCAYGEPSLTFYGSIRSIFRLKSDGNFLYRGSGGAAYSSFGNYTLSYDGTSLIRNYYYHTEPTELTEDGYYDTIIYRDNSNGESEETDMTIDDFADMAEDLSYMTVRLDLTPFSEYTPKAQKRRS